MAKIRTRFAPSPTGRMHVGNLRTALYTYLIAKHEGGDFVLRIEDTDQKREVKNAVSGIVKSLQEFGIEPDEELELDVEAYVNERTDNQLDRAIEILEQEIVK